MTIWAYSWIPDKEGRYWVRITEILRIPGVYYLDFLLGWAVLYGFMFIERKIKPEPNSVVTSVGKQTLYILGVVLVYSLFVGASIATEYLDWKAGLTTLMIMYTTVFTIGSVLSFMLLKQVVPQRIRTDPEEKADLQEGIVNEAAVTEDLGTNL